MSNAKVRHRRRRRAQRSATRRALRARERFVAAQSMRLANTIATAQRLYGLAEVEPDPLLQGFQFRSTGARVQVSPGVYAALQRLPVGTQRTKNPGIWQFPQEQRT